MSDKAMISQKIEDRIATIERHFSELRTKDEADDLIILEGEYIIREAYDRIRSAEPLILEAQNRKEERSKKKTALQKEIDTIKWVADAFYEEFSQDTEAMSAVRANAESAVLANTNPVTPEPAPAVVEMSVRDKIVRVLAFVKTPLTVAEIRDLDRSLHNPQSVGGALSGLLRAGKVYLAEDDKWALAAAS